MTQQLSTAAFEDFKRVLIQEFGAEALSRFTDDMIHELGLTLLKMEISCRKTLIKHGLRRSPSAQWRIPQNKKEQVLKILEKAEENESGMGRPRIDPLLVLEGILWYQNNSGASWSKLPDRYPQKTCYRFFLRWRKNGVLNEAIEALTDFPECGA